MIRLSLKVKSSASSNGFAKFGRYSRELLDLAGKRKRHVPLESNGNYHEGPVLAQSGRSANAVLLSPAARDDIAIQGGVAARPIAP